jgi:hypothetical protein
VLSDVRADALDTADGRIPEVERRFAAIIAGGRQSLPGDFGRR